MSRTAARPSMYPTPSTPSHWQALSACSAALQASCAHMQGAVGILEQGTCDLSRLAGIVQSRRMFDLVTEPEVFSAQKALANEMRPQIEELITRAETGLEGLKEREKGLKVKVRLVYKYQPSSAFTPFSANVLSLTMWRNRVCVEQLDARTSNRAVTASPISASQEELDELEQKLAELRARKERLGREVGLLEEKVEEGQKKGRR
ncbi:hypothetical protein JCM11641_000712 [Rhodosporidiobolus odoratus]